MNKVLSKKGKNGSYLTRMLALILAVLVLFGTAPSGILYAYGETATVSDWAGLREAVEAVGAGESATITLSGNSFVAYKSITVKGNVTIKSDGETTIYRSGAEGADNDFSNFVVDGGTLTLGDSVTLTGKSLGQNCDDVLVTPAQDAEYETIINWKPMELTQFNATLQEKYPDGEEWIEVNEDVKSRLNGGYVILSLSDNSYVASLNRDNSDEINYLPYANIFETKSITKVDGSTYNYNSLKTNDARIRLSEYDSDANDGEPSYKLYAENGNIIEHEYYGLHTQTDGKHVVADGKDHGRDNNKTVWSYNSGELWYKGASLHIAWDEYQSNWPGVISLHTNAGRGRLAKANLTIYMAYEEQIKVKDATEAVYEKDCSESGQECAIYTSETFTGGTAADPKGFFVQVNGGTLNIEGATLTDFITNGSVQNAAPVVANGGAVNIGSGSIEHNSVGYNADNSKSGMPATHQSEESVQSYLGGLNANNTAGAIIFTNGATGEISGAAEVSNNRGDAGALYVDKGASVTVTGNSKIDSNVGIHKAGAAHITNGGSVKMTGGSMTNNVTWYKGGAVCATSYQCETKTATFVLDGGSLTENFAMLRAGAIEVESDEVQLLSGTISGNYCRALGGGIYVEGDEADHMYSLYISSSCITGNNAVGEYESVPENKTEDNQKLDRTLNIAEGCSFSNELDGGIASGLTGDIKDFTRWGDYQGYGGGLWLCAIGGNATFGEDLVDSDLDYTYNTIIKGNTAVKSRGQDINLRPTRPNKGSAINILGLDLTTNRWYIEDSDPKQYIENGVTYTGPLKIVNEDTSQGCDGALQITNNIARIGGGIAANGTVVFGKASNTVKLNTSIKVEKSWSDKIPEDERKPIKLQLSLKDGDEITPIDGYSTTLDGTTDTDVSDNTPAWEESEWVGYFSLPLTTTKANGEVVSLFEIKNPETGEWLDPSKIENQKIICDLVQSGKSASDFEVKYAFVVTETSEEGSFVLKTGDIALSEIVVEPGEQKTYQDLSGRTIATVRVDLMTLTFGDEVSNEPLESEKYIEENVHKEINVNESFTYEIISYVPEGADKITVTDELGEYLQFKGDGNVKVFDLGTENNHKTSDKAAEDNETATVETEGTDITKDVTEIDTENNTLNVVIANEYTIADGKINYSKELLKDLDLYGHYVLVKFDAELTDAAKEQIDQIVSGEITDKVTDNGILKVTEEQLTHEGIGNKAKYSVEVANGGKYEKDTNEVTVKPDEEKPEIEKYINQNVHEDISLDDEFTYDIVAYVTSDADKVVITDTLDSQLKFVSEEADVTVVDLGDKNNHKTADKASADGESATVNAEGTAIEDAVVSINDGVLTVTIDDEVTVNEEDGTIDRAKHVVEGLRGHYVKVTFKAALTDEAKENIEALAKESIENNDPLDVTDDQKNHEGIPNKASYDIEVANEIKYNDDSNTVTVTPNPPDETEVLISKTDLGGEELEGAEMKVVQVVSADSDDEDAEAEEVEIATWTSTTSPKKLSLKAGTYKMTEVVSPVGYKSVTTEMTFAVDEDNNVTVEEVVENDIVMFSLADGDDANHIVLRNAPEENPEEPEIEKYVNQNVHEDIDLDDEFTYDIVVYVTSDADKVVITDTLDSQLKFVSEEADVTVVDLGEENKHKTADKATADGEAATVNAEGTAIEDAEVSINDGVLTVTIDDEVTVNEEAGTIDRAKHVVEGLRGHYVKVTFKAALTDEAKENIEALAKESVESNDPLDVTDSQKKHEGIPNKASYDIEVANKSKYHDDSNTVTVVPPTPENPDEHTIKISKTDATENNGSEIPGAEIELKDEDGNVIEKWTSTSEGPHEVTLTPGKYTMKEVNAPEGFQAITTEIKFEVDEDGKVTLLNATEIPEGEGAVDLMSEDHIVIKDMPKPATPPTDEPEIEKYVNKAVHAELKATADTFTYDIIAYVTEDADLVTITDKLNDILTFASEDVKVVDLGTENNHQVKNNVSGQLVHENATVDEDGTPVEGAEITVDQAAKTLTVKIANKLVPVYAEAAAAEATDEAQADEAVAEAAGEQTADEAEEAPAEEAATDETAANETEEAQADNTEATDEKATDDQPAEETANDEATEEPAEEAESEIVGYEPAEDGQYVTPLRGHWIKVTFEAKIDNKTLDEIKAAYEKVLADKAEDRAEDNKGNAPVISDSDHEGVPNSASYTIGVGNEPDAYTDKSNTVTVVPPTPVTPPDTPDNPPDTPDNPPEEPENPPTPPETPDNPPDEPDIPNTPGEPENPPGTPDTPPEIPSTPGEPEEPPVTPTPPTTPENPPTVPNTPGTPDNPPNIPNTPGTPTTPSTPSTPKTGDDSNMGLWITIMLLAAATTTGVAVKRSRKERY